MQPRKLRIAIANFAYGGNGGTASEVPDIRKWMVGVTAWALEDDRVQDVVSETFSDTPITMTRNAAIDWAKQVKADVLVMVDSDQAPDLMLGNDPLARPFMPTSFDFLYKHYEKGPVTIFAPYCGPPTHPTQGGFENVYVFRWLQQNDCFGPGKGWKFENYSRGEAAGLAGIQNADAGPTGLCMMDMRLMDHLVHPYFDYEWDGEGTSCPACHQMIPGKRTQKASTEDIYFFRNIALHGCLRLGYNPVFCNWDAWAGHWKPLCVGKPTTLTSDQVSRHFHEIVKSGTRSDMKQVNFAAPDRPPSTAPVVTLTAEQVLGTKATTTPEKDLSDPLAKAQNTCDQDLEWLQRLVFNDSASTFMTGRKYRIVELGSWTGDSALVMAAAADQAAEFEVHCVDHWQGGNKLQRNAAKNGEAYDEFKRKTSLHGDRIIAHRGSTVEIAAEWAKRAPLEREIDFLFIDADHTYEGCLADIQNWVPFVRNGGLICGHDYHHGCPGVKRAVHEAFGYDVQVIGTVWSIRKPGGYGCQPQQGTLSHVPELKRKRKTATSSLTLPHKSRITQILNGQQQRSKRSPNSSSQRKSRTS